MFASAVKPRARAGVTSERFTWQNVVPLYRNVLIAVFTGVLVMQTQSVNDLVAQIPHATYLGKKHRLASSLTTDEGGAAKEVNKSHLYSRF